jgi:hypothetical protein
MAQVKPQQQEHAMEREPDATRRGFAQVAAAAGLITLGGLWTPVSAAEHRNPKRNKTSGTSHEEAEESVTPPEDLMREHGVLDRLLLVYEAGLRKFDASEDFDPAILTGAAQIVRDFIENYHEQSEEQAVFPRFKRAGKQVTLAPAGVRDPVFHRNVSTARRARGYRAVSATEGHRIVARI